jgi:hypothetical protein
VKELLSGGEQRKPPKPEKAGAGQMLLNSGAENDFFAS